MAEMTPLERAARALVAELGRQDTGREIDPARITFSSGLVVDYIDQTGVDVGALVRVVLSAIREPSVGMIHAGDMALDSDCRMECSGEPAWQAMIDAMLAEKGDETTA